MPQYHQLNHLAQRGTMLARFVHGHCIIVYLPLPQRGLTFATRHRGGWLSGRELLDDFAIGSKLS